VTGDPTRDDQGASGRVATDRTASVEVEDLSVRLGDQSVLSGASLSVEPGSLVGLVGPNGAGKTTLLRTINATLEPDSGRVLVGGEAVHGLSAREVARRVATVPQDTTVPFSFPVRRVVEMGRHPHRPRFGADPDPDAVDRALERADVADLADRPVDAVSGGERSRVMLARALAQDAPVFVLDEPTASLDVNHQVATLDLVRELVADGRTVLAAIHDLDLAARYCDAIAVLSGGRILAEGPPASVLTESVVAEAFGANAVVVDHPVTGSPLVTALGERSTAIPARATTNGEIPEGVEIPENGKPLEDGEGPEDGSREGGEDRPDGDPRVGDAIPREGDD